MIKNKIKIKDTVMFLGDFFKVEWIDDSGNSCLIGLKSLEGKIVVTDFSEKIILKVEEEN